MVTDQKIKKLKKRQKRSSKAMFYVSYFTGVLLGYIVYLFQS